MKKIITLSIILTLVMSYAGAQVFQVDTLQYKGTGSKYINFVMLGDGYTSAEQTNFISDATTLSTYLLSQSPWSNYINYFNVFAIRVISTQSGAKHPNNCSDCSAASPLVPVSNPTTYLGCSFDSYGIHRLLVPQNTSNIASVLATNFPSYDQVFIISNSPYYGGSGGTYATSSVNASSNEINAHEVGHSFAYLADEYYAGDGYAMEKPNMTKETNTALVKWKNWIGTNSIGINQHCCGGNSALWYKPHNNCKMQYLGSPFCSVCKQTIIESIHALVNPIVSYAPAAGTINSANQYIDFELTEVMKPIPNTLRTVWKLDGNIVLKNTDLLHLDQNTLSNGTHSLTVSVTDTTSMLKVDNHATTHLYTVSWSINKTSTGIILSADENKIEYSIYPNPSSNVLTISTEIANKNNVSIDLISADGKLIQQIINKPMEKGIYTTTVNIENLLSGTYSIVFKAGEVIHTETFIKQ
jgi:hypothetical protein